MQPASPKPILVVDDDPDIRETLAEVLADRGYGVVTAANGRDAIALLKSSSAERLPAAVLLDLMMPVLDGYGFLEEAKADPVLAGIPVAIISAGHKLDHGRLASHPLVPKPIKLQQLFEVLRAFGNPTAG